MGAARRSLYRHVPQALIERPKMGFGIPIDAWLRGPLKDWAEALIAERRLAGEGYFRPEPIRAAWARPPERPGQYGNIICGRY